MSKLVKFTTAYVPAEDRIRLSGEYRDGQPVILWFTQRMLKRLVPLIAAWLEQGDALAPDRVATQQFRQDAARAGLQQHPPVQAPGDAASWVVTSIDHGSNAGMMQLRFRGQEDQAAILALAPEPARQWLDFLFDAARKGDWPRDGWPAWIGGEASGQGPSPIRH